MACHGDNQRAAATFAQIDMTLASSVNAILISSGAAKQEREQAAVASRGKNATRQRLSNLAI
jgi:hypothetical protein